MHPTNKVEIKKPCHENWDAMTLNDKGRFCEVCQLTVVDFTTKTPEEISLLLKSSSSEHQCGNFNSWDVKSENKLDKLLWKLNTKGFRYVALFILGIMVLVGCRTRRTSGAYTWSSQSPRTSDELFIKNDSIQ